MFGGWVGLEGVEPFADVVAEDGHVDTAEVGWVALELAEGGVEEALGPEGIVAMQVVKSDCNLDQTLEEGFFWLGGGEPDAFPGLVGVEEFADAIEAEAFG